jgi:hypothetical protein
MSFAASPRARRTINSSTRRSTRYTTETTTAAILLSTDRARLNTQVTADASILRPDTLAEAG